MKLTIKRSKWLTGSKLPMLLNPKGRMCCLGFLAIKCGADKEYISGHGSPGDTPSVAWPKGLLETNNQVITTDTCDLLMKVNDDRSIRRSEREVQIKELFKKININVRFID